MNKILTLALIISTTAFGGSYKGLTQDVYNAAADDGSVYAGAHHMTMFFGVQPVEEHIWAVVNIYPSISRALDGRGNTLPNSRNITIELDWDTHAAALSALNTAITTHLVGTDGTGYTGAGINRYIGLQSKDTSTEVGADLVFSVTLSSTQTQTVTVDYATADGTAQANTDYTPQLGTLTFAADTTVLTQTIAVPTAGVGTVLLTLTNAAGIDPIVGPPAQTGVEIYCIDLNPASAAFGSVATGTITEEN